MDLKTYLETLDSKSARQKFASDANTTLGYLDHLKTGRKRPSRIDVLLNLIRASDGKLTLTGLRPDLFAGKGGAKARKYIEQASVAAVSGKGVSS